MGHVPEIGGYDHSYGKSLAINKPADYQKLLFFMI